VNADEGSLPAAVRTPSAWKRRLPMFVLVVVVASLAVTLRRTGMGWGDDYTLYLRQAHSLIDGNIDQVISDNRFNVDNAATPSFSPYVYPWGWPMLLAPFARLLGNDFERLKLVGVACWCLFLVLFERLLRPRLGRVVTFWTVAPVGITLAYLQHTHSLLSEIPFMAAAAATLVWLDRCRSAGRLDQATRRQLVVLGTLALAAFNIRREGVALIAAIGVTQLVEIGPTLRSGGNARVDWRKVATPHVTFLAGMVLFQLLVPSALMPKYDDAGLHQTWSKLGGSFRSSFGRQLGFDSVSGVVLIIVLTLAILGLVARCRRHAADDVALAVFAVLAPTLAGMIPAVSPRYTMAATPLVLSFAVQGLLALTSRLHFDGRRLFGQSPSRVVVTGLLVLLVALHVHRLPSTISETREINAAGGIADGPLRRPAMDAYDAVRQFTRSDDVIAFFKARSMTFFTDRRAVQSKSLDVVVARADYYLMRRDSTDGQPLTGPERALALRFTQVWSNDEWILWRIPNSDG
jgi:hypothetical protein